MLDESGYTEMWRQDKTPEAAGRLENLKELVRAMEQFPDLAGFLEHVSLVMETDEAAGARRVSIMTLHGAKGLEFETVFLPGWEEGLFPHQRSLDENGRAGLEEERRLAYVGITRAKRRARIYLRHQQAHPRAVADDDPLALHRRICRRRMSRSSSRTGASQYGAYGVSRFANLDSLWLGLYDAGLEARPERAKGTGAARRALPRQTSRPSSRGKCWRNRPRRRAFRRARACCTSNSAPARCRRSDGSKLTVDFDKAGRKMVMESFVEPT